MDISRHTERISDRKWEILAFSIILATGIFLRAYNFHDWLHFEIDQTYDFNIVSSAVENGPGNLPLLGPTAGGGRALRLGPAFYYLEYVCALVFGNTPTGHAMLVLILGILSIPLFYLFSERYFTKNVSLALTAVFAVSFYNVSYSRFSWSPNVLPFLTLLTFFSLLKSVRKDAPNRERWFLLATAAGAIVTQIHFNAFFTVPPIAIAFLLIKRPRFPLKTWIMALLIGVVAYSPMIASDLRTGGENIGLLEKKVFKASGAPLNIGRALVGDMQHHLSAYFFIVTGQGEMNNRKIQEFALSEADQSAMTRSENILAVIFLVTALLSITSSIFTEKSPGKRDFLLLVALWFSVSFLYFFSIVSGYRMYPRFFLLVSPIAVLFLGFALSAFSPFVSRRHRRLGTVSLVLLTAVLVGSNLSKTASSFGQLGGNDGRKTPKLETEDIFPNTARMTLSQQEDIADYIRSISERSGFPAYLSTVAEFKPAFWYHLGQRNIPYYGEIHDEPLYREADYFWIVQSDKSPKAGERFILKEKKEFGSLTAYFFSANDRFVTDRRQDENAKETTQETKDILDLPTWNKLR